MLTKFETDFTLAVLVFFLLLYGQSGWYRIDCALGEPKACALISDEYAKEIQNGREERP